MIIIAETVNPKSLKLPIRINNLNGEPTLLIPSEKNKACWAILQNRMHLLDNVEHSSFERFTFLVDQEQGFFGRFDNRIRELLKDGNKLYLRKKRGYKEMTLIYANGVFYPTKRKGLMVSGQGSGDDNEYKCCTLRKGIILKDHQMIGLFKNGEVGMLGIDSIYENNHIDRDTFNNSASNLILGTSGENQEHKNANLERKVLVKRGGQIVFNV
ncbi:hypothetical protein PCCS19_20990 [Paenibacillus sp. CCS19]|uniref:hypothetical protein n=1 Tax=Paenibacillus sp. CCS19 TaxID=3158387 RepID=UPI00256C3D04|nr:hypothetical protein [Paenibacillus cellulosilyticus]GMK39045.1 hypothetical protein PCCS19_20990 [Paenibacillus cellulosilyticus]